MASASENLAGATTEDTRFCYGASCTWCGPIQEVSNMGKHSRWKAANIPDDVRKHSLPCCPHCGGMLLELPHAKEWWDGVDKYDADGHPGYGAMWRWQRQMNKRAPLCFPNLETLERTYKNRGRDNRFRLRHG
jgi:hypothetical protein